MYAIVFYLTVRYINYAQCILLIAQIGCIPAEAVSHQASDFQFLRKTRQRPANTTTRYFNNQKNGHRKNDGKLAKPASLRKWPVNGGGHPSYHLAYSNKALYGFEMQVSKQK